MKNAIKKITLVLILFLSTGIAIAQEKEVIISGSLIEQETKQPIPYATVVVKDIDTANVFVGTTTNDKGEFRLATKENDFLVEISFMGYTTRIISDFKIENSVLDLGTITLESESQSLEEVEVRGEVSKTVFKLDKRVFNVGKDLSSTGMSGLEVLDNVPSVNVSIDGEISLRGGAGVQILINGNHLCWLMNQVMLWEPLPQI